MLETFVLFLFISFDLGTLPLDYASLVIDIGSSGQMCWVLLFAPE